MAGDQRPGRGHADEDGAGPGADAGAGFLAQRGVRLVADHDRVGVGDFLVVADEPLVGLDRDRAVGVVAVAEQRRAQALLVAAVGDLADELVDQVAAVGEDQHAAGAGGLDEADRGDGLAGAGRVLEPEAALGAGVLGRLLDDLLVLLGRLFLPVLRLLVGGQLLVLVLLVLVARRPSSGRRPRRSASALVAVLDRPRRRSAAVCCSAISSVRVPESASTWCGFSSAPSRSFGGSSASNRSSPSSSEKSRRHWIEGSSAPSSSSSSAASSARRRAVPGASASGPSPSSRKGSRANSAARSMSALEGTAACAATSLVLAIEGFWVPSLPNDATVRLGQVNEAARSRLVVSPRALSAVREPRTERTYCNHGIG